MVWGTLMQIFGNVWSLLQVKQPQYRLKYCKKLQCDILSFFQNLTITDQKAYGMLSSCYFFCFKVKCKQEEIKQFSLFTNVFQKQPGLRTDLSVLPFRVLELCICLALKCHGDSLLGRSGTNSLPSWASWLHLRNHRGKSACSRLYKN